MLINSLFANCFASGWILSETRLKNLSFHKSWHQISDFNEKTMGSNGIFIIFIDLLESFVFVQILYVLYCMVILYISIFCLRKKTAGSSLLLSQGLWVQVPIWGAAGFESHPIQRGGVSVWGVSWWVPGQASSLLAPVQERLSKEKSAWSLCSQVRTKSGFSSVWSHRSYLVSCFPACGGVVAFLVEFQAGNHSSLGPETHCGSSGCPGKLVPGLSSSHHLGRHSGPQRNQVHVSLPHDEREEHHASL